MIVIDNNFAGAILAFVGGAAIAWLCYMLSKYMLKKKPSHFSSMQIVRQLLQIAYLVILFTLGGYTPWEPIWLLVGGCVGITVPMFYFTFRLVKINDSMKRSDEKEDKEDG